MPDFNLVDQPDSIAALLHDHRHIGVDTEFMRERTFFAELCLVQVATDEHIYCVDPLAGNGMRDFWDCIIGKTWIVHSARQDIEVIYHTAEAMPQRIFDTQVAAGLLGYPPQMGYGSLVKELFDVEIDKSHTRADWSRRPLTDALLQYAAEDVEYLLPAFEVLAECLDKKGRLAWAEEDSAQLLDPGLYDTDPRTAIDRLKGARNLRGRRRAAAARLAEWREAEALRANRPRQWILKDSVLIELATALPSSAAELDHIDGLPAGLVRRAGKNILRAISASHAEGDGYRPPAPPNESKKSLLKDMQRQVAACAHDLGIAAETVASKRELTDVIIAGNRESRLLKGWRGELLGPRLRDSLE